MQSLISSTSPNIAQSAMSMIHSYTRSCNLECVHHQPKTDDGLKPSHCVIYVDYIPCFSIQEGKTADDLEIEIGMNNILMF